MIYKTLEVENFRGIRHLKIEDLNFINVFVGKNNSGKSSILEAIFLLTGISNPELILRIDRFRNLLHNEEDDFRFAFYNLNYQNIPIIISDLHPEDSSRQLTIRPINTNVKGGDITQVTFPREQMKSSDSASSLNYNATNGLSFEGEIKRRHSQKKVLRPSISMHKGFNNETSFTITPTKDYKESIVGVFLNNETFFTETHKRIENLIIKKRKEFIIENLKRIDESITDIVVGSNNVIYFDIGADRLIPSNLLGDGINKIVSIIATLSELKNGILLVDEIDNGLHFATLEILWNIIYILCIENNNQLFITTHNYDVLKYIVKYIEKLKSENEKYKEMVNCYSVSKLKGNDLKAYKYKYDELRYSIEQGIEIRDDQ